jgi:hypothetical protein
MMVAVGADLLAVVAAVAMPPDADGDGGGSRTGPQDSEGEDSGNKLFHGNSFRKLPKWRENNAIPTRRVPYPGTLRRDGMGI